MTEFPQSPLVPEGPDAALEARLHVQDSEGWAPLVTDSGRAEWAMFRLAQANAHLREVQEYAETWRANLDAWVVQASQRAALMADVLTSELEGFALLVRALEHDRTKTVSVPSGKITTRSTSARVTVSDPAAFIEWATEHRPDLLVRVPKVNHEALSEAAVIARGVDHWVVNTLCGHTARLDDEPPGEGEVIICGECGERTAAKAVGTVEREFAVIDGEVEPPGLAVQPAKVSATVKPGPTYGLPAAPQSFGTGSGLSAAPRALGEAQRAR